MRLGYNTNGLSEHGLLAAIELLAEIGYRSVAITLNHNALNPFATGWEQQAHSVRETLDRHRMNSVIETSARYLLDPRNKHEPTLVSADEQQRKRRIDFLCKAIDIAQRLESDCISCWSGTTRDEASDQEVLDRLGRGLDRVLDYADQCGVVVGFEPEPGMFVDSISGYERLLQWFDTPRLMLTLDVGHLYCQGEVPIADYISRCGSRIVNVHLEDMRAGIHEHLMFGEGEMQFRPIIEAFEEIGYRAGLHVELNRHSHVGPMVARQAYEFLQPLADFQSPEDD